MKIRAITLGYNLKPTASNPQPGKQLPETLTRIHTLKARFEGNGIPVQSIRLCTTPFIHQARHDPPISASIEPTAPDYNRDLAVLNRLVTENQVNYYSYLPALCDEITPLTERDRALFRQIPSLLRQNPAMFTSIQAASTSHGILAEPLEISSEIITTLAAMDPFLNLKFAVTFNVPANTPFFPSAYHLGDQPKISIALEAADEIVAILEQHPPTHTPIKEIQSRIRERFTAIYDHIMGIIQPFCDRTQIGFHGVDFSPAPYPHREKSIATVIELLGLGHFGDQGTLYAVGVVTEALKSVPRPSIGYSGFMQPILEDAILAQRNREGNVDLNKILLYSTVCGLGLDCVPIPGTVSKAQLTCLLLDLATISVRLQKPLSARLMPIPGKSAGEMTAFEFEYFANSTICGVSPYRGLDIDAFLHRNKKL